MQRTPYKRSNASELPTLEWRNVKNLNPEVWTCKALCRRLSVVFDCPMPTNSSHATLAAEFRQQVSDGCTRYMLDGAPAALAVLRADEPIGDEGSDRFIVPTYAA